MLEEAAYDTTQLGMTGSNPDDSLMVSFSLFPHRNEEKSLTEGRDIYEEIEYVTIIVPGDKDNIIHRPVWEQDMQRFPRQYAMFKNKDVTGIVGTPLKTVSWLTGSQVKELEFFGCRTVEQLAAMSDTNIQKFMGAQELRRKARDFIEVAKGNAPMEQMRKELTDRDAKIAEQEAQMAALVARLDALEKVKTK